MIESGASEPAVTPESKLPRRDWILLPALGLLTIGLMTVSTEFIAALLFRPGLVKDPTSMGCFVENNHFRSFHAIPNTACTIKMYESETVEYRFNSCGHRAGMECGPKSPDTYRIVMMGSSFAYGLGVPREKSVAALLPVELSKQTGRKVELYNESMLAEFTGKAVLDFDHVLAAQPDLILWILTPADIRYSLEPLDEDAAPSDVRQKGFLSRIYYRVKVSLAMHQTRGTIASIWYHALGWFRRGSPSGIFLEHVLYSSQDQYVKSCLIGPDGDIGFLRSAPSSDWQNDLRRFDRDAAEIERRALAAQVPLVAVLVPNRVQAAMISRGEWPDGFDPYKLDAELRSSVVSHGGTYIDILPDFRSILNPEQYYFVVDGHANPAGHTAVSALLAKALSGGAIPAALKVNGSAQVALTQSR